MDRTERFHRINQLLRQHRAVSIKQLVQALGVARATVCRHLEYLRDRFNAPIVFDHTLNGYRYDQAPGAAPFALPGLWLSAAEIHALLSCHRMSEPHKNKEAAYSGLSFGASFSLLAERAHIPIKYTG